VTLRAFDSAPSRSSLRSYETGARSYLTSVQAGSERYDGATMSESQLEAQKWINEVGKMAW
jgi:hypothetical protein